MDKKNLKVQYIGESDKFGLINGKIYDVISIEKDCYRIVDETEEDYLYHIKNFIIV